MLRRPLLLIAVLAGVLALAACNGKSPTSPIDPASTPHGRLSGMVTIGPNCPVETLDHPCPTPPSAYAARKILVYDEAKVNLLHTVDIDSSGFYSIDLVPARYTIDFRGAGIDRSSDVPKVITISANAVTTLDISIDTGLR
ncbi:MAG TPA: hypothetical protein VEZ11_03610 [Thermoanaerobaculia bacterium]|nr:hypothetical protein [Thermoanaerobaculia bacterium]